MHRTSHNHTLHAKIILDIIVVYGTYIELSWKTIDSSRKPIHGFMLKYRASIYNIFLGPLVMYMDWLSYVCLAIGGIK